MPGSHGGGGGGSHSSHVGSHSGSGSGNSITFSTSRPFPGAKRYYYHNHLGHRCHFYSSVIPSRRNLASYLIGPFIFLVAAIIVGIFMSTSGVLSPKKLEENYQLTNYTYDNIEVLEDKDGLEDKLENFYDKTGVQPVVYTNNLNHYTSVYGSYTYDKFESYGLDVYEDLFNDECHWLIVYVQNEDASIWHWVEIYGYDTEEIITDSLFEEFQDILQSGLEDESTPISTDFINAFDVAYNHALTWDSDKISEAFMAYLFIGIMALISIIAFISTIHECKIVNEYCDYRDKNNGVDSFEEVSPNEYNINSSDSFETNTSTSSYKSTNNSQSKKSTSDQFTIDEDEYKIDKNDF